VVFDGVHGIINGDESLAYPAKVLPESEYLSKILFFINGSQLYEKLNMIISYTNLSFFFLFFYFLSPFYNFISFNTVNQKALLVFWDLNFFPPSANQFKIRSILSL